MLDDIVTATIPDELRGRYLDEGYWDESTLGALLAGYLRADSQQTMRVWSKMAPRELTFTLADITSHLAGIGMAKPKWPEELRVAVAFPRTASGKVQKYLLRNQIR